MEETDERRAMRTTTVFFFVSLIFVCSKRVGPVTDMSGKSFYLSLCDPTQQNDICSGNDR